MVDELDEELMRLHNAVDLFADAMKARLDEEAERGRSGWDDPGWVKNGDARSRMLLNAGAGDHQSLVDAANFAMFIWWHEKEGHVIQKY